MDVFFIFENGRILLKRSNFLRYFVFFDTAGFTLLHRLLARYNPLITLRSLPKNFIIYRAQSRIRTSWTAETKAIKGSGRRCQQCSAFGFYHWLTPPLCVLSGRGGHFFSVRWRPKSCRFKQNAEARIVYLHRLILINQHPKLPGIQLAFINYTRYCAVTLWCSTSKLTRTPDACWWKRS